jgi:hypothetical protein
VIAAAASLEFHGRPVLAGGSRLVIGAGEDDDSALASGPLRLWVIDRGGNHAQAVPRASLVSTRRTLPDTSPMGSRFAAACDACDQ